MERSKHDCKTKSKQPIGIMRYILVARLLKRRFPCSEVSSIKSKVTNSDWRHRHTVICVEFFSQRFPLCFGGFFSKDFFYAVWLCARHSKKARANLHAKRHPSLRWFAEVFKLHSFQEEGIKVNK